jgi:hypothetical protein
MPQSFRSPRKNFPVNMQFLNLQFFYDFALGPVRVGLCVSLRPLRLCDKIPPLETWSLGFSWDLDFGVWDFDLSPSCLSVFIRG